MQGDLRLVLHGRKRLATALSGLALATDGGLRARHPRSGRARHRRRAVARRPALPRGRAGLRAAQRRQDRARRAAPRPGLAEADQDRQDAKLEAAREDLQDSIVSQYEGQNLSAVGQVAVADDADAFVSSLSTMSAYNDLQAQLFDSFTTEAKALDIRSKATEQRAAEVQRTQDQLAAEKKTIDTKLAEAEELLDQLKAEEREALLSRGSVRLPSGVATSGRAAAALRVRDGPGRRLLRLRRRRPQRLRLLRPDDDGLGAGRRLAAALVQRPVRLRARTSPPATCSRATWSSTTRRSATSGCTSATA